MPLKHLIHVLNVSVAVHSLQGLFFYCFVRFLVKFIVIDEKIKAFQIFQLVSKTYRVI